MKLNEKKNCKKSSSNRLEEINHVKLKRNRAVADPTLIWVTPDHFSNCKIYYFLLAYSQLVLSEEQPDELQEVLYKSTYFKLML